MPAPIRKSTRNRSQTTWARDLTQPHSFRDDLRAAAHWYALRAELSKRTGTSDAYADAFREIGEAIRRWNTVLAAEPNDEYARVGRARCRQDEARLYQYIEHDNEKAAAVYAELVIDGQLPDLTMAVVKRNYAECLRRLSPGRGSAQWIQAQQHLSDAFSLAKDYETSPIPVEILYEQSRVAGEEGRRGDEITLLNHTIMAATEGGAFMVAAIARNALYWAEADAFSLSAWRPIESGLARYQSDAWAARALMNSRIRAAQHAWTQGLAEEAREMLLTNRRFLEERRLDAGCSDRKRIAYTYAGLSITTGTSAPWSEVMDSFSPVKDFLGKEGISQASDLWATPF